MVSRHVWCWLASRQRNRQHMQFTGVKEKLVKSRKTAGGTFRKKGGKKLTLRRPPPPVHPANNKILKKYGPNRSFRWTKRSLGTRGAF